MSTIETVKVTIERESIEQAVIELRIDPRDFATWSDGAPMDPVLVAEYVEAHRGFPDHLRAELEAAEWKPVHGSIFRVRRDAR